MKIMTIDSGCAIKLGGDETKVENYMHYDRNAFFKVVDKSEEDYIVTADEYGIKGLYVIKGNKAKEWN